MTKKEKDYLKYLELVEEYKRKAGQMKEALDQERDALVLHALKTMEITRAQGEKLARLIRNKESFEKIMEMELMPDKIKDAMKSGDIESEDDLYEDEETE